MVGLRCAWFTDAPESYLGDACVCPKCGGHHLKADRDILDVWWDSGVSWKAVCEYRPEIKYPADVYLEGSDQHRGRLQSSLLTSVGTNGIAPYKAVISQGFTLDGQGRKMSKSLGNVIDPNKICDEMGADIIRLWVASVVTSTDVACDAEILARTSDAYRRFRNTLRFLLSVLEGPFEPTTDGVAFDELMPLDKLMLARLTQVQAEVDAAYEGFEFTRAYRTLYDFVVTELANVYLDALKVRLYCETPTTDGVAFDELMPLDKLMLARLTQVQAEVDAAYEGFEFNRAYRTLYDFVVTELSNVYLDALKDRLYCEKPGSHEMRSYLDALKDRLYCEKPGSHEMRSAQTVVAELLSMLMRDLQPILSYTVDEAMEFAPAGCRDNQEYAALLDWYKSPITLPRRAEGPPVLREARQPRDAQRADRRGRAALHAHARPAADSVLHGR